MLRLGPSHMIPVASLVNSASTCAHSAVGPSTAPARALGTRPVQPPSRSLRHLHRLAGHQQSPSVRRPALSSPAAAAPLAKPATVFVMPGRGTSCAHRCRIWSGPAHLNAPTRHRRVLRTTCRSPIVGLPQPHIRSSRQRPTRDHASLTNKPTAVHRHPRSVPVATMSCALPRVSGRSSRAYSRQ